MSDFLKNVKKGTEDPGVQNPLKAAQVAMQPELPKRFYKECTVVKAEGAFLVLLDGKSIKTPGKNTICLPTREAAEILCREWQAQETVIDPKSMHATRIVNTAIDGISQNVQGVLDDIVKYAGSDLLCYRAEAPQDLVEKQASHWDPILNWVRIEFEAKFFLVQGIMPASQSEETISAFKSAVDEYQDPISVACLHTFTSMSGSALLALALAKKQISPEAAWEAAHVDEHWNESLWGEDFEAIAARAKKFDEFLASFDLFRSVSS